MIAVLFNLRHLRVFIISWTLTLLLLFTSGGLLPSMAEQSSAKKILFIIAHRDFRDEELKYPKDMLEAKGAQVTIASDMKGEASGMLGAKVNVTMSLAEVNVSKYDAVVFVGGSGAVSLFNNDKAHKIAQDAVSKGKILGAICLGPSILARAGVMKGKKATVFSSEAGTLKKSGAVYTGTSVERDGLIVTADGPESARQFGQALIDVIFKK